MFISENMKEKCNVDVVILSHQTVLTHFYKKSRKWIYKIEFSFDLASVSLSSVNLSLFIVPSILSLFNKNNEYF